MRTRFTSIELRQGLAEAADQEASPLPGAVQAPDDPAAAEEASSELTPETAAPDIAQ